MILIEKTEVMGFEQAIHDDPASPLFLQPETHCNAKLRGFG